MKLRGRLGGGAMAVVQPQGPGRSVNPSWAFDLNYPEIVDALNFFDRLHTSVTDSGARLAVVFFPSAYCVHRQDVGRWYHGGQSDIDAEVGFNRAFCDYLNRQGIACLNIHSSLVSAAGRHEERLYYWLDLHWTALGNDVAARATADYLLGQANEKAGP